MAQEREKSVVPPKLRAAMELTGWLLATTVGVLLAAIGVLPEEGCIWLATLMLVGLYLASWRNFGGGRHPCFLFFAALLVFQGGRLIAHVLGGLPEPMQIAVATAVPFRISTTAAEVTLLLLVLSGICVYGPCRLGYKPVVFRVGGETRWLPALYMLILLTLPFAFYRNWAEFSYIRAHGGYLAIFTDNAAVSQSAGTVVRSTAMLNSTALLIAYVFERRPKRIFWLLVLYSALSVLTLLIGLRGEVLTQVLGLWFIHKLKTGRRFSLLPLLLTAVVVSLMAVAVAAFRENLTLQFLSPLGFLAQQGVSLNVTEGAVAYHHLFSRYGAAYVFWGFVNVLRPLSGSTHRLWTTDLTTFLNPEEARLGFGTATSYLAELYLLGGLTATIMGSVIVGWCFNVLHRISAKATGAVAMAIVLPKMIYLPRLELLAPLGYLIRGAASAVVVAALVLVLDAGLNVLRRVARSAVERNKLPLPGGSGAGTLL
jgi:hypothetical protein